MTLVVSALAFDRPAMGQERAAPPSGAAVPSGAGSPTSAASSALGRIGAAEVAIVGGNIASARERAVAEAIKQAVDQALGVLVPDARTTQPKIVAQVLGRSRGYVRRYRTVEEGERGRGLYGVRIEADVDETALQRAFEKPPGGPAAALGSAPASAPSYLLVGAGIPEAIVVAGRAFTSAGARVQQAGADLMEPIKAVAAAGRAGIASVAFVSASATADGKVRGPGVESVTCAISVRVLSAGTGLAVADETETIRSFASDVDRARADCFERAAAAVVPRVIPTATGRSAPDMRSIVVDADIVEPGAVPALVKQLRGIGSVSAIEVRRIAAGRVELWVRSRLPGAALATTMARDLGGALTVSVTEVTGDLVRVRARLREAGPPSAAPNQTPPPPTTGTPTPNQKPNP